MENPGRMCTVCLCHGKLGVPASLVATDELGFQWFECDGHSPGVFGDLVRVRREPIDDWFRAIPEAN